MIAIRPASASDLDAVLAITNDVIASSTAIYNDRPVTLDDRRAWPGYRFTVEHSVQVRAGWRGQGLGRQLVEALFPMAAGLGKHVMIAGVDAGNAASLRFHERLGFERAAHFREVGYKFGRWLDLVLLQRFLDAPGASR